MEVCGTHTMSLFQSGLHDLLPSEIKHLSGPGCPVCVTSPEELSACLDLAYNHDLIMVTFGDMIRVPDHQGRSLKSVQSEGAAIQVCYSPSEALSLARKKQNKHVVLLGIGFETTAPAIAAIVQEAFRQGIPNFSVFSCHKCIPAALRALLQDEQVQVDAFLLPGHVSSIIGLSPYRFLAEEFHVPGIIAGFEPLDILTALYTLVIQDKKSIFQVINQYKRAVKDEGNQTAQKIMTESFDIIDTKWRGLGVLPKSGLQLRDKYKDFDTKRRFHLTPQEVLDPPGCCCGSILTGKMRPDECPLFKKTCSPSHPVGPCMVSTEGSCAAYFRYQR